ncbi:hypothetical protein SODG_002832 [Sodalis praecaptivus]
MSLFRRGNVWYGNYTTPGGKRIKESLGTTDRKQAQEFHDRRKAELWRIDKLGDFPEVSFDEACLRWLEEKSHKKSLDADKGRIGFWLMHFEGVLLKNITEAEIYSAVSKMTNRKSEARWHQKAAAMSKKVLTLVIIRQNQFLLQQKLSTLH